MGRLGNALSTSAPFRRSSGQTSGGSKNAMSMTSDLGVGNFRDLGFDRGAFLAYAAVQSIVIIDERTDRGVDHRGRKFEGYQSHRWRLLNRTTRSWLRDERGRFVSVIERHGALSHVTLRSLEEVPVGRRMRDNLKYTPKAPKPTQKYVTIKYIGSRKRERPAWRQLSGKEKLNTRHDSKANLVHAGKGGKGGTAKPRPRIWVRITDRERNFILAGIVDRRYLLGFLSNLNSVRLTKATKRKVKVKRRLTKADRERKKARADARRTAVGRRHDAGVQRLHNDIAAMYERYEHERTADE